MVPENKVVIPDFILEEGFEGGAEEGQDGTPSRTKKGLGA